MGRGRGMGRRIGGGGEGEGGREGGTSGSGDRVWCGAAHVSVVCALVAETLRGRSVG